MYVQCIGRGALEADGPASFRRFGYRVVRKLFLFGTEWTETLSCSDVQSGMRRYDTVWYRVDRDVIMQCGTEWRGTL